MKFSHFVLLLILPLAALCPMIQLEEANLEGADTQNEAARSGTIVVLNPDYDWKYTPGDYFIYDSVSFGQNMQTQMTGDPQWDRVQINWIDEIRMEIFADSPCTIASYSGQCHHMTFSMGLNFTAFNDTNQPADQMTTNMTSSTDSFFPTNYNGWKSEVGSTHTGMWMGEQNQGDMMRASMWENKTTEIDTTGWVTNFTLNDNWNEQEHLWTNTTVEEFSEHNNSGNWQINPPYTDSYSSDQEIDWVYEASQEFPFTFNSYNQADSSGSAPSTITGMLVDVWQDDKGTLIQEESQLLSQFGFQLSAGAGNLTEYYHLYAASFGTDTDGDGVFDGIDLCPNTTNGATVDSNGCSWEQRDDDNDSVLNPDDDCSDTTPTMTDVDAQGCAYEQRDEDNDGVLNSDDNCLNTPTGETVDANGCSLGQLDSDNDGVSDADDACPGHDDSVDVDSDGVADGCDSLIDSDNDGVADSTDACPGHDDSVDVDQDGTPDGCDTIVDSDSDGVADSSDACPGHDDSIDVDGDGTPDGCDSLIDSDGDNVADGADVCPGHDDAIDVDADGIADGCDDFVDSDSDGVVDADDKCAGHDDAIDVDGDGTPDGCDSLIDSDGDGVSDSNDACPGYIDSFDADADGIPDGCDDLIDDDDDGIGNGDDQCPGTVVGTTVDDTGCEKKSEPAASTSSGGFSPIMGLGIVAVIAAIGAIVFLVVRRGSIGGGSNQQPPQAAPRAGQIGGLGMEPVATSAVSTPPVAATPTVSTPPVSTPTAPASQPPQSGGPPLPAGGLPAGWTMHQWEHYGDEYLRKLRGE